MARYRRTRRRRGTFGRRKRNSKRTRTRRIKKIYISRGGTRL